jgi:hypothetical protein
MSLTLIGAFALTTDNGSYKTYDRNTFGSVLKVINSVSFVALSLSIVP